VFATSGSQSIYQDRYREIPSDRWAVISNGYDEEQFTLAEREYRAQERDPKQIALLHSGVLYGGTDRDPSAFFGALSKLKKSGQITAAGLKVILRASGYEDHYRALIREAEIEDLVFLEPQIPYRAALAEMINADGLLIFQGYTSNPAIPAKLYEYFRARRPILALVDDAGDTARTLRENGVGFMVAMDHVDSIADGVVQFLKLIAERKSPVLDLAAAQRYSRRAQTQQLASLLDTIVQ
jgi:glycosyltransferase involved in cell wall biosynthesis